MVQTLCWVTFLRKYEAFSWLWNLSNKIKDNIWTLKALHAVLSHWTAMSGSCVVRLMLLCPAHINVTNSLLQIPTFSCPTAWLHSLAPLLPRASQKHRGVCFGMRRLVATAAGYHHKGITSAARKAGEAKKIFTVKSVTTRSLNFTVWWQNMVEKFTWIC